jgi:hypothetical protein
VDPLGALFLIVGFLFLSSGKALAAEITFCLAIQRGGLRHLLNFVRMAVTASGDVDFSVDALLWGADIIRSCSQVRDHRRDFSLDAKRDAHGISIVLT